VLVKKLEVDFSYRFFLIFFDFIFAAVFLEKPFYEEALDLTRNYKPITEKLVEPIQPLQLDPTSKFNILSSVVAQVSVLIHFFFFFIY
jgi:hypothetical protein